MSCGTLLVKTSLSIGTGKSYLVKDDDWIIIIFRLFPLGEGYIWAKLKKWNWHQPDYCHYYYSIVNWNVVFSCTCHNCNVAQVQTSGTNTWFEGPSPKRTMMEDFETSPWSSLLTWSLNFFSCAALHVRVLLQSKFHKAGVTCRRSRLMKRKSLTG